MYYNVNRKNCFQAKKEEFEIMNEKRVNEIISQITAFSKDTYTKSEFLPELFKFQKELVDLTFNAEHAENGTLQLQDVESHLSKMNDERGHVADIELSKFIQGSKVVCNKIRAEISGNFGEQKVFSILKNLNCQNSVLRNVELEFDGRRTEIDAIVFTNHAAFIIEIKNSKKNIFIDENGDFYRIGSSMHHDGNIADKMNEREALLRKALERAGMECMKIFKIVTFTNSYIDVECKYRYIKVCPSNYLNSFIEKFTSNQWYSYENICIMTEAVTEVKCPEEYQMSIDMTEFKRDFAVLMAKLETAEEADFESGHIDQPYEKAVNTSDVKVEVNSTKQTLHSYGKGMVAAAAIGVTLLNVALLVGGILSRK